MHIMCIVFVQHFESQGRRFTNVHYYHYYYEMFSGFLSFRLSAGTDRNWPSGNHWHHSHHCLVADKTLQLQRRHHWPP